MSGLSLKFAEIIAPSIVGTTGLSITIGWTIWHFLHKTAEAELKTGTEISEEQSAVVQKFGVSSVSRLSEDPVWLEDIGVDLNRVADIENSILQEETVNTRDFDDHVDCANRGDGCKCEPSV